MMKMEHIINNSQKINKIKFNNYKKKLIIKIQKKLIKLFKVKEKEFKNWKK